MLKDESDGRKVLFYNYYRFDIENYTYKKVKTVFSRKLKPNVARYLNR